MTGRTVRGWVLVALAGSTVALLLSGCSDAAPSSLAIPRAAPSTSSPTPAAARAVPGPERDVCHQMTYDQALAPTDTSPAADCTRPHTAETFAVGELKTAVDGHLLAVDSTRVQRQVADLCPRRLASWAGGTVDDLRLSMLRAVWFTPTVAESDNGANWLRCDAIVVSADNTLAPVRLSLRGALADASLRDALAMCATTEPGAPGSEQVPCRDEHTWRAVAVVDLPAGDYPGVRQARAAGQDVCQDVGSERADDPLDFQWGYQWPTAEQWTAGQTYGRCWIPD